MIFQELLILLAAIWIMVKIVRRFGWPLMFGDILAGLVVGPVVLGWVHNTESIQFLAELGIFFLMLHAGLEANPRELMNVGKTSFSIAIGGALLPFALGVATALAFGLSMTEALFIGVALSITAISVSARLFKEEKLVHSKVAQITMTAAIVDDVLGLMLFSAVLDISAGHGLDLMALAWLTVKVLLFFGLTLGLGCWLSKHTNKVLYKGNKGFTLVLIIALSFSFIAEFIGLHFIIGAFLAGLFIREEVVDHTLFAKIEDRVFALSYSFLGPIFFATLAFHFDLSGLMLLPALTVSLLAVAILGKVVGAGVPALLSGVSRLESLGIGVAMNSRGAVELIIAAIGYERGIIGEGVFSVLVLLAFLTTVLSLFGFKPLARRLRPEPAGSCCL